MQLVAADKGPLHPQNLKMDLHQANSWGQALSLTNCVGTAVHKPEVIGFAVKRVEKEKRERYRNGEGALHLIFHCPLQRYF